MDTALFESAAGMADAANYADWTFSLFAPYVRGDVLEVGCGVGTFTRLLVAAPAVRRILSIDVSPEAVAYCRAAISHPSLELKHADVRDVPDAFDAVICMNVLEHIQDDEGALRHMIERLRPGGTLFLLVPAHQALYSEFDHEGGHYRRYNKRHMRGLIDRAARATPLAVRQFYFNSIGALGYFVVYRILKKPPRADATAEVGWFDRYVVPVQRRIERNRSPFGISLVSVITKER
ncbi:MAG: class I SAM-dependent methyltransferase [Acidobacteria bacterium]|nr:class I SAM-dependent methyltransferase [Acidobacteriota bacterium]